MNNKLESIVEVQRATEQAMKKVIDYLKNSEKPNSETAHQIIDDILEKYNCESPENHIVAGGVQAIDPHEEGFGDLTPGTAIVIDIYPRSRETGFFADMTRTVCVGKSSAKLNKMYDSVLEAQNIAIKMLKPGRKCIDIQKKVEKYFEKNGYKTFGKGKEFKYSEGFVHGVGHGVSDILHDLPRIGRDTDDILKEGDIITIEPGLYYKDIGGIRIEDLFLITSYGFKRITNFSNKFEI